MRDKSGQYQLVKKLGEGGMGVVWQGVRRGQGLEMPCAIKVLLWHLAQSEKDRRRFFNEARIAARLNHGNIVKVIDTGEVQGCPFLVMVWVDGKNLRELLTKAAEAGMERLPLELTGFIVERILAALEYAHNRKEGGRDAGVIHYDVTPGNIMISSTGEVKLTDFGISHFAATVGPLSRSVGTPRYMSPEQITGHPRRETDIYSLGVVLWELLSGCRVRYLANADADQFRARVLMGPSAEIERDDVPEPLRRLVRQMLSVRPQDRPTAAECRTVLVNHTPNIHTASQTLQTLYRSIIGDPSSGFTELMSLDEAVSELRHSLDAPPRGTPDAMTAASGQLRTLGEAVRAQTPAPIVLEDDRRDGDAPSMRRRHKLVSIETGAATFTGTPESIEQTEVLPPLPSPTGTELAEPVTAERYSGPPPELQIPAAAQRPREVHHSTEPMPMSIAPTPAGGYDSTPERRKAETSAPSVPIEAPVTEKPAGVRVSGWLIGGLFAFALANGGVFVWMLLSNEDEPAVETAVASAEEAPAEPPPAPTDPQPAEDTTPAEPSAATTRGDGPIPPADAAQQPIPEPTEPTPTPETKTSKPSAVEPTSQGATTPSASHEKEPEPRSKPKKSAPAREEVVFMIDGVKQAEIKVRSRTYPHNLAAYVKLRPGKHAVSWRKSETDKWRSAGTLTVDELPGKQYYDVKITGSTLKSTVKGTK